MADIHDTKRDVEHLEETRSYEKGQLDPIDPVLERQTLRKVDLRLLPMLGALYAIALIDRTNISLARVAGMLVDLRLGVGERYSIVSLMFFIPYIIFELPSNIVLRKLGVANWLGFIVVAWGAVTIGMAFCKTWTDLLVCRVLLGLLEAGFFPGCVMVVSSWYTRIEVGKRMTFFYIVSNVIAGFSAILAYGLSTLRGRAGLAGWRWIFLVEGIITCGLGLIGWFVIVDFPDKAKFLSPEQKALVHDRIQRDRGDAVYEEVTLRSFGSALADIKLWGFAFMFMNATMPSYVVAYFGPVILGGFGFSVRDAQLLSAPPYVVAAILSFIGAWASDRFRIRGAVICFQAIVCLVGLVVVGYTKPIGARYLGLFLTLWGAMGNVPAVLAWMTNTVVGTSKKSVGSALVIGFGGIGGIFATTVFRQKDYPRYIPGILTTIGLQVLTLIISCSMMLFMARKNKLAREGKVLIENRQGFLYIL